MENVINPIKAADTYKAEWEAFKAIREEFAGHFDRYAAFRAGEDSASASAAALTEPRRATCTKASNPVSGGSLFIPALQECSLCTRNKLLRICTTMLQVRTGPCLSGILSK